MEAIEQTLRTFLKPLTSNLPKPIEQAATELLGESCYRSLVRDLTITDSVCLKLAVSKALGVVIIAASSIVKVPQLLKLLNSQSAEGISFLSYLLETASYIIGLAYNARNGFPFSTYGETALIAVQNIAISVLVLRYSGQTAGAVVFLAGLGAAGYSLFSDSVVSMSVLQLLQAGAGLLSISSKLPQIIAIFQQGGTGQLSAFAVFNYLLGSLTRIFTTLTEVDDPLILYGFIAGFALNAVLALQMVFYWNAPASKGTEAKKLTPAGKEAIKAPNGSAKSSGAEKSKSSPSTRRRG
ncbi:mannose-P-dolichol utilization defect 1 protein [Polychaeton citri CBS 116435]|uniref:Mannose-P-dolichol utilization defect 1 protein homolog n=1 Tax=Polychaeton citri CBS 116435 TaxID=1314669 RepID=A0A9P4Q2X2_9PEZI|nr:mannose-P-dolichol utilization defect 1 protein [Polychaeton citri CBS 116435]